MTINKFNYEVYALDYLEGNLSPEMTEEMERFLKTHPAIESELSGMLEITLLEPDTSIKFEPKAALLKREKVVWLHKKWIRPLMMAASFALLISTFFLGYQAGQGNQPTEIITKSEPSKIDNSKKVATPEDKLPEPIIEQTQPLVKAEKKGTTSSKNIVKKKTPIAKTATPVRKKSTEHTVAIPPEPITQYPEELTAQVADNENIRKVEKIAVPSLEPINKIQPIVFLNIQMVAVKSQNDTINNLASALASSLPIEETIYTNASKKKRNIRDLFGRFHIQNLREAIIPTYYKEEVAGQ